MDKVPERGAGAWPEWENQFLVLSGGRPRFLLILISFCLPLSTPASKKRSHSIELSNKQQDLLNGHNYSLCVLVHQVL